MKVPISWLKEYVDLEGLTPRDLADLLTFSGIEVEGVAEVGHDYEGFVVGEVRQCEPHPNADRLRVCRVFDGETEVAVVCGAPNVAAGQKVCLARLGAKLPDGTAIKRAKIRGIESFGMLCAADELGLAGDHSGLLLLDAAQPAGRPLAEVLPPPETVFDLEITWNRPDCLSIIGIAREFAALLERPLRLPEVALAESDAPVAQLAQVRVEDPAGCPRYVARVVTDLTDGPAPAWMQQRLERCGVRPISLIVDVTNYVMLECGQPLHAFDHAQIAGQTIVVRRARPGEVLLTLDGTRRPLDVQTLVIADPQTALAIAGVMGGAGSEIAPDTRTVLLESALFDAPGIKRTATSMGMRTESSHRYERGVDPGLADWASRRAAALLAVHGGGRVAAGAVDVDHRPATARSVDLRFDRARAVIGVGLADAEMVRLLESLGLTVQARDALQASFDLPTWRGDLTCEADLIEEIARLHGLASIPDTDPAAIAVPGIDDAWFRGQAFCRDLLLGLGFSEAMHYSFLSTAELDDWDATTAGRRVVLPNPVSSDYAVLRDSLLPQMATALGRNMARPVESVALFEMGRIFVRGTDGQPTEEHRLALGLGGPLGRPVLDRRRAVTPEEAAMWLKGAIESVAASLHAGTPEFVAEAHPACTPGWGATIRLNGATIGWLGLVSSALRHAWRVTAPLAVAELRLAPLLANPERLPPLRALPPYPSVRRDLACLAPCTLPHATLAAAIRRAGPPELTDIRLFDIFRGKEIGSERRSLAYALEFRSTERTMTDDEVNGAVTAIVRVLRDDFGVEVRES